MLGTQHSCMVLNLQEIMSRDAVYKNTCSTQVIGCRKKKSINKNIYFHQCMDISDVLTHPHHLEICFEILFPMAKHTSGLNMSQFCYIQVWILNVLCRERIPHVRD